MKKFALINPGKNKVYGLQEPLQLAIIAGYLEKNGVKVKIIDQLAGHDVEKELDRFQPDMAGITATTPLANDAYEIAAMCRKKGIPTIMGGKHASALPEEALQHVDCVVKNEGEYALLDIINNGIKKKVYEGEYVKDLDSLPFPAYHLLDMEYYMRTKDRVQETYLQYVGLHKKVASIITSRGCPYSCIFCHNSWKDLPYRFHSAEYVIKLIKHLIELFDIDIIWFFDDNLFANKPRLKKICQLMKENSINLPWAGNARVDNLDRESLLIVKNAGCKQITFGFESGSQRILDILKKETTVEQNDKAIKLCNEVGLLANGTFMIGNPTETVEDIKKTQKFIREHKLAGAGVLITTPFPKTELWEWCKKNNKIPESFKWSDYNYHDIPINVSDIPPKLLKKLWDETAYIHLTHGPVRLATMISEIIKHPIKQFKSVLINPRRVPNILKRIKI